MSKSNDKNYISCKVVTVGQTGVGKTCILHALKGNPFNENHNSTTVAQYDMKLMKIKNSKVQIRLDLWDTAGQEKFRALTKLYFKGTKVVMCVYDITDRNSFNEIEEVWLKMFFEYSEQKNELIAIAANKADLYENQEVDEEEGRKLAEKYNGLFFLISALSGEGIDEMFQKISEEFYMRSEGKQIKKNVVVLEKRGTKRKCC